MIMATRLPSEIIRIIAGHIRETNSPEQELRFREWLATPGNDREYSKVLKIWNSIAEKDISADSEKAWEEFSRRLEQQKQDRIRQVLRILGSTAAAAAIAVAAIFSYRAFESSDIRSVSFASVSGKSSVSLPDGSGVILDRGSSISYDRSFGKKQRSIHAEGRVFFDVAKDRKRPFVVETGGLKIKVLGTKFDVDSRQDKVIVSLVEGSVSLSTEEQEKGRTMSPGEVAVYDRKNGEVNISSGDVRSSMLWCFDRLSFSDATLDKVCHDLSQWYGVNVVLSENLYGKGCINFTITDESLDSVLSIISRTTRVNYRFEGPKSVIVY